MRRPWAGFFGPFGPLGLGGGWYGGRGRGGLAKAAAGIPKTLPRRLLAGTVLLEDGEDGFLGVEAVFCFCEDGVGVGFEDFGGDFLFAVGGEAVHDEDVFAGAGDEVGVDLVGLEVGDAFSGFIFLAHADPDVGVEDVGVFDGFDGVRFDGDVAAFEFAEEFGGRLVAFGGADDELEAEFFSGPHP